MLGKFTFIALVIFVGTLATGISGMLLWRWYVVPFGVSEINFATALGLGLVFRVLSGYKNEVELGGKEFNEMKGKLAGSAIAPFVALFFGWLLKFYM